MYAQAYQQTLSQAASQGVLDKSSKNAQRVQTIARRLIAQAPVFRADAAQWNWQVNLIDSEELNANCGPGGKIIVYSGLIERLQLTDAELAAVMGHEIAHALREHSREAMSKAYGTQMATQVGAALLGLGIAEINARRAVDQALIRLGDEAELSAVIRAALQELGR